ncbi:MAG: zf-HC2 domain-containing protein [Candidatus Omnitrophica bacterium]|nr:zf-HC2 domain-containing protein [Candidatus Omnitrophota bacterium]
MKTNLSNECDWFEDRIEEYLDRDRDPGWRSRFDTHLEACSRCREEFALAQRVTAALASLPPMECPESVERTVLGRDESEGVSISSRGPEVSEWSFWRALLGWAPLSLPLAILVVALMVESPSEEKISKPSQAPQEYSKAEIEQADRQLKVTMAYLGKVGLKGIALAGREAIEEGILVPTEKTMVAMLETDALSFGKERANKREANR